MADHATVHDRHTGLTEVFLHDGFVLGLGQILGFDAKDIELLTQASIQFQPVFIVGFNAVDGAIFMEEEGDCSSDLVQVFQIIHAEVFSQSRFELIVELVIRFLADS